MTESGARVYDQYGQAASLSLLDRGLAYGDGVFETMRVHNARIPLLDRHLVRMRRGLGRLGIAEQAATTLQRLAAEWVDGMWSGVLKVIVTRGEGGRGYLPPVDAEVRMVVSRHELPAPVDVASCPGLVLGTPSVVLSGNRVLAGIKHLNRLEQVLARAEMHRLGHDEGLMFDASGTLVEAVSANVLLVRDGVLLVPAHDEAGVAGVMAGWCVDWCNDNGVPVRVSRMSRADVLAADELLLCNVVRGVLPAGRWESRQWSDRSMCLKLTSAAQIEGLGF